MTNKELFTRKEWFNKLIEASDYTEATQIINDAPEEYKEDMHFLKTCINWEKRKKISGKEAVARLFK